MARPSADPDPTEPDLAERDTEAFPLQPGGRKGEGHAVAAPGTLIADKYRVLRVVGQGGMGLVVEARHEALGSRVAIKVLLPELLGFAEAAERFTREARAVARLKSEHVARVLDVGALPSGEPFQVMEYLEGEDLAHLVDAVGKLPIEDALDHAVQACDALAEAHGRGIVHRDLKLANLFLTQRKGGGPLVKLLDFGVSKILGEGSGEVGLTRTTMILGSALYMSPEQMRSAKAVDHRTDIYALGVCLFEMIGGRPPYEAESFPELCALVFTAPPADLRALRPEVPTGLVRVLERTLARNPADRPQSVAELVQALAPYAREDTRASIARILREHAPALELPPPALAQDPEEPPDDRLLSGEPDAPPRAAALPDRAEPRVREERRPRRSRAILALAILVLSAGPAAGLLLLRSPGREVGTAPVIPDAPVDEVITDPAVPAAEPSAVELAAAGLGEVPAASAGAASEPVDAGAVSDGGAAEAGAAEAGVREAGVREAGGVARPSPAPAGWKGAVSPPESETGDHGTGQPGPALLPGLSEKTPPPPVNTDLVQETCTAILPDGTRKQVPCN